MPYCNEPEVFLETEGSIQEIQKRALFHHKKVKKDTANLTSPYVHSLFTIVVIKQTKKKQQVIKGSIQKLDSVLA